MSEIERKNREGYNGWIATDYIDRDTGETWLTEYENPTDGSNGPASAAGDQEFHH